MGLPGEQPAEDVMEEEPGDLFIGNIDDIGDGTIVINDQGYIVSDKTVCIARSGARTSIEGFQAGDIVSYTFSEAPLTLLTLEMSSEETAQELQKEQTKEVQQQGGLILKDGVWTN